MFRPHSDGTAVHWSALASVAERVVVLRTPAETNRVGQRDVESETFAKKNKNSSCIVLPQEYQDRKKQ